MKGSTRNSPAELWAKPATEQLIQGAAGEVAWRDGVADARDASRGEENGGG